MLNYSTYPGGQPQALTVTVHSASNLVNVEHFGKQDPFVQLSLNYSDASSYQKTFTHKDAGKNATWNQTLTLPGSSSELYVEVMDEETFAAAELIGFAAIPLNQVVQGQLAAVFPLYTVDGKTAGDLYLTLSYSQQQYPSPQFVRGQSYINEGHQQRCKSLRKKAVMSDVGAIAAGGALAVGAGLLGKKLFDNYQHDQAQRQEEQERFERERQRLEEEKARLHQQQQEFQQHQHQQYSHPEHQGGGSPHHHHQHHHHHQGGHGARAWDPVGTYAAGDRVEYHGRTYVCLQGHTSNPTWMPGAAHSLWQPC